MREQDEIAAIRLDRLMADFVKRYCRPEDYPAAARDVIEIVGVAIQAATEAGVHETLKVVGEVMDG